MTQYSFISNVPNQLNRQDEIVVPLWPEFMLHDPVANIYWNSLFKYFPEYQIFLMDNDEILGIANSIPFRWENDIDTLPDEGWDWVLQKGIEDYENHSVPNMLNGLQIAIKKDAQGKGLSALIVRELQRMAREHRFSYLTFPIRPSLKNLYPLIPMDDYITWKREDGMPFDPWLRVHTKCGGKIIKTCHRAMYIPGTIKAWETWTDLSFLQSGNYVVNGALCPVIIDLDKDRGEYIEPNVWVVHEVGK